ncbi:MAG: HDOD domain-containing protein [Planctomycetaceae bacterium]|nr:HDOD domain-containing protein [Planctomycetaceae bacterium]
MKTSIRKSKTRRPSTGAGPSRDPALERLFSRMTGASAFSANAREIVRLANRSTGSLEELQKLIQTDPSLVALLLRRVNSPYYHLDRHVQDLTVAAHLLGFREFRNLAITVYLSRMFESPMEDGAFRTAGLWNHCVAVAAAAHLVSRVCGCGIPADAYIAGLLHDIGFLLIHRHVHRRFAQLVARARGALTILEEERSAYGFDHAQLGAYLARQWDFPAAVVDAVQFHHSVDTYAGPHLQFVSVVAATNYLCSRAGWTSLGVHSLPLPPDSVYRALGLDHLALTVIWDELLPTLDKATSLATA